MPRGQPAWATLARPVAVVAAGTSGAGAVSIAEGATGFPVAVTPTGATGIAGSVPARAYLALQVRGREVAAGRADDRGRFALAGQVPAGAIATVRWGPCATGSGGDQHPRHKAAAHADNQNRDEAPTNGQGCSTAGDGAPDS